MKQASEKRGRRALFAGVFVALLSQGAGADLVGHMQTRAAVAGKSDEALVQANPILERFGSEHPEALDEILARLRAPVPESSGLRTFTQTTASANETDAIIFAQNPDLSQLYRESPEAALDLLRLIREAAKNQ